MKRCIIFSYGPVPSPEQNKVEGGGLRCWGLAKGLRAQDKELDITIAYHESYKKDDSPTSFETINITTWSEGSISDLVLDHDSVIVSYCMGDLSVKVAKAVRANQQLILDCYVPIYVEISARGSKDLENEYMAFRSEIHRWSKVLKRGDLYLCANENQKRYYQGVLSALGRINPATYDDNLLLIAPYGIYKEKPKVKTRPITTILKDKKEDGYKKILWFGAVYPWFDLRTLVDAVRKINESLPVKLIIVGAKNPFNAHPDFIERHNELIEYVDSNEENKKNIIFQDWIEFDNRADWYLDSDLVILINKIGEENELAWRTRLVDYMWADLPILTNGGDPLGEELIDAGAASRLENLSAEGLAMSISNVLDEPKNLDTLKHNLSKVRKKYYWEEVTSELYLKIMSHTRPSDFAQFGLIDVDINDPKHVSTPKKIIKKAKTVPKYYKKYGARSTYAVLKTVAHEKIYQKVTTREPRVVFIAHQLDTTGAPHVFIDAVKDFREANKSIPIDFHTFNPADNTNLITLNKAGIKPRVHLSKDISLTYTKGDVVVLNTVAFSDTMRDSIYEKLEEGIIKKLVWYVHEDEPGYIFEKNETKRIKRLMGKGRIIMFVAAVKTRDNYVKHFGVDDQVRTQAYRVDVAKEFHKQRSESDFEKLDFILPGMVGDGRKGQLPIIYAFIEFKKRYFDLSPENYRDFSLTYIGLGKDFLSRQLLNHSKSGLGDKFIHYGKVSHEKCFEYVLKANVTVCYSMREALPMFVYEGMVAGHPLLRNDSSGMEEQLVDGENGFYLESKDFEQVVETIEKMCRIDVTSSKKLSKMSEKSYDIATKLEHLKYDTIGECISTAYKG